MNEVEITVSVRDKTDTAFVNIRQKSKKHGEDSADNFRNGFSASFTRGASNFFGNLAENATGILGRSFGTAASSNPVLGGGIAAIIGAGLIVGMPAIGSLAAGALVAGFGGGIAAIGIMAAAQTDEVQDSFEDLKKHVASVSREIGKPFVPALQSIAVRARETFDSLVPILQESASKMAIPIDRFAGRVQEALANLQPAIGPLTDAFDSLIGAVGDRLPGMAASLSGALQNLAQSVDENADSIASLVSGVNSLVVAGINAVAWLTDFNDSMLDTARNTGMNTDVLTLGWSALLRHRLGSEDAARGSQSFSSAMREAEESATGQKRALDNLNEALQNNHEINIGMFDAETALSQSKRKFIQVLKDGTKSFHGNSEAVDENRNALSDVAKDIVDLVNKQDSAFGSTKRHEQSLYDQRDAFIASTRATGKQKQALTNYLSELLGIPVKKPTRIVNNAGSAKGPVQAYIYTLHGIPRVITTRIRQVIDVIPSRMSEHQVRASGGIVGATAQSGGPRSNSVLVGEHGPEIVDLPSGSMVHSNPDSMRMMSGGPAWGGGLLRITLNIGDKSLGELIIDPLRKSVRTRGGDVQAVLGR